MSIKANMFFGSQEVEGKSYTDVFNPYDGKLASQVAQCETSDAAKMLELAISANKNSKANPVPLSQRINWIKDVAKKLKEKKEEFAKTITDETAKPITFARVEVDRVIETLELTAAFAIENGGQLFDTDATDSGKISLAFTKRVPLGVVVAITPFNFPLNLVAHKLAPALVSGNFVILKPAPETPLTAYKFAKLFIESKYAVRDALSIVYGDADIGSTLVTSSIPRKISFTGSVPVGNIISKSAGIKKLALELGGNAATFIESSADLKYAAARCAFGAFANSGQVCISLQRIYVDEKIYDEFASLIAEETKKLKVGSCYDDDTFLSSLINKEATDRSLNWIESAKKEGAIVVAGGEIVDNALQPTVFTNVTDDMNIICEEVFAPIVSLVKVKSYEEAVEKMNNSPYGLQFSIFTNNLKLAKSSIDDFECGGVVVNDIPTLRFDIQPYGGVKHSGIGKEGPKYAIEEFTELKSVVIL